MHSSRSTRSRPGFGLLAAVCALSFCAGMIVFAMNSLWRGSSRNLFALEEHRQLVGLCRSSISEAMYKVQTQLEQGSSTWIDFCTREGQPGDKSVALTFTREFAAGMTNSGNLLQYTITDVTAHRVLGVSYAAGMSGATGAIDFTVTATVERHAPNHAAHITLIVRHAFWFSDAPTPFPQAGRHVEILPTPAATMLRVD